MIFLINYTYDTKYDWNFTQLYSSHPTLSASGKPRKPGASKQARFNVIFSMAQSIYLLNSDETSGSGYFGEDFLKLKSLTHNFGEGFLLVVIWKEKI